MKKTNILIVEDELVIAFDLQRQLEKLGYEICDISPSVAEARIALKKHKPDLALLDIRLQGKALGTELGKELKIEGTIPFIYLTSHFDKATVEEAKSTRPSAYLIKPFAKEDIYVAIEVALMNFAHSRIDEPPSAKAPDKQAIAPLRIKKVVQYIHENLDRKITLPELAGKAGWNMYYFARTFKKYLNESPYQYMLKARIEKSKTLLVTENRNLAQIAFSLGFENHSHFSQTFRKIVGISPDAFRKSQTV